VEPLLRGARGVPEQVGTALAIAFWPKYAYGSRSFELLHGGAADLERRLPVYYPTVGRDFDASRAESTTVLILSGLFGLLQVAAVGKARSVAGSTGGILGTVFGILSMSCCAPLIAPRS
jgi:hypothetical protein